MAEQAAIEGYGAGDRPEAIGGWADFILVTALVFGVWWLRTAEASQLLKQLLLVGLMLIGAVSFRNATVMLAPFLFFDFLQGTELAGITGLAIQRVLFVPFLFQGLSTKGVRSFPGSRALAVLLLISVAAIKLTSYLEGSVYGFLQIGFFNRVAAWADVAIVVAFFYFAFTRLSADQLKGLFRLLLFLAFVEGAWLLYTGATNPAVFLPTGKGYYNEILWANQYFGHKQTWGTLFAGIGLVGFGLAARETRFRVFYSVLALGAVALVVISLSRSAYVVLALGLLYLAIRFRSPRYAALVGLGAAGLAILKPGFALTRVESLLSSTSVTDVQAASGGHLGPVAVAQYLNNVTLIPNLGRVPWQYNWSEGIWNGVLFQQGVIGLLLCWVVLLLLWRRARLCAQSSSVELAGAGIVVSALLLTVFLLGFVNNFAYFMSTTGRFPQLGLLVATLVLICEVQLSEDSAPGRPSSGGASIGPVPPARPAASQ